MLTIPHRLEKDFLSSTGELYVLIEDSKENIKETLQKNENEKEQPQETSASVKLDRGSNLLKSSMYILLFLTLETSKQLCMFGLSSSKDVRQFPFAKTIIVTLTELVKLGIILSVGYFTKTQVLKQGLSLKFCVPSFCYFLTGIIYLYALTKTSPPIWIILIQTRTLYTAILYKVKFGKNVTIVQTIGCVLIVLSIPLTKLADIQSDKFTVTTEILLLSQLASILSSVACLAVEIFLKNDGRSFVEQQFNLYLWGIIGGIFAFICLDDVFELYSQIKIIQEDGKLIGYLAISIILTALAGLCVPVIVKKLDSIVKDYIAALNNIIVAALTAIIFPDIFSINRMYLVSMGILILGITLYEWQFKTQKSK